MGAKKARNADRQKRGARKDSVLIGQVHGDRVHPRWALNIRLVDKRDSVTGQFRIVGVLDTSASGAHVATGRCKIVKDFLAHPAEPEWLWMVDTDATFEATILDQLLESADATERPIVGALAFGLKPAQGGDGLESMNGLGAGPQEAFPTLYLFDMEAQKSFRVWNYEPDSLMEVDGTGCHCLLVHRSVFEHPIWDLTHPLPWFRSGTAWGGGEVSEDLFFCMGAKAAGFPIFVNTAAKTGHIKEIVVDEWFYLSQRAPKRERPRVVLVPSRDPVLCRATVQQLVGFGEQHEIVVAWNGTNRAFRDWLATQPVTVIDVDPDAGIHAWWNWAIDNRPDADVAFLNDDLILQPGCVDGLFASLLMTMPRVGASCANYDNREPGPGADLLEMTEICAGRYDGTGGFAGFCFAVSRDWLDVTGYRFPEEAKWWCGDNDLLHSVQRSGWLPVMVLPARCTHLDGGGKTGDWAAPELQAQLAADIAWLRAKWSPQAAVA